MKIGSLIPAALLIAAGPAICEDSGAEAAGLPSKSEEVAGDGGKSEKEAPDIMVVGSIGGIKIGSGEDQVRAAVEGKLFMSEEIEEGATGLFVQEWLIPEAGLSLKMESEKAGGAKSVGAITIKAPSTLKTERGIGIGSEEAEAKKAYRGFKSEADEGFLNGADAQLVGSIYGGMIIYFEEGRVSEVFLGAAAE